MKVKKFIEDVQDFLGLSDVKAKNKEKAIKHLVKKLEERKKEVKDKIEKSSNKKEQKELEEELSLINLQIKKGHKKLEKM